MKKYTFLSWILLILLLLNTSLYTYTSIPGIAPSTPLSQFGQIVDTFHGAANKMVYCIEDVHTQKDVQYNIAEIIKIIAQSGNPIIGVEGSEGFINTDIISSIPIKIITKGVIDNLLDKGLISGPEIFSSVYKNDAIIYGLEDKLIYDENLKAFINTLKDNNSIQKDLKDILNFINTAKNRLLYFSNDDFEKIKLLYRNNKITFKSYISILKKYSESLAINLNNYENLFTYTEYGQFLDIHNFLYEIDSLENEISIVLNNNNQDLKDCVFLERGTKLLAGYLSNTIMNKEVEEWNNIKDRYFEKLDTFGNKIIPINFLKSTVPKLKDAISMMDRFYVLAKKRDEVMVRNLLKQISGRNEKLKIRNEGEKIKNSNSFSQNSHFSFPISKNSVAILIAGGFHTKGITQILRSKGISYKVIRPKINGPINRELYLRRLKEQAKETGDWKSETRDVETRHGVSLQNTNNDSLALAHIIHTGAINQTILNSIQINLSDYIENSNNPNDVDLFFNNFKEAYNKSQKDKIIDVNIKTIKNIKKITIILNDKTFIYEIEISDSKPLKLLFKQSYLIIKPLNKKSQTSDKKTSTHSDKEDINELILKKTFLDRLLVKRKEENKKYSLYKAEDLENPIVKDVKDVEVLETKDKVFLKIRNGNDSWALFDINDLENPLLKNKYALNLIRIGNEHYIQTIIDPGNKKTKESELYQIDDDFKLSYKFQEGTIKDIQKINGKICAIIFTEKGRRIYHNLSFNPNDYSDVKDAEFIKTPNKIFLLLKKTGKEKKSLYELENLDKPLIDDIENITIETNSRFIQIKKNNMTYLYYYNNFKKTIIENSGKIITNNTNDYPIICVQEENYRWKVFEYNTSQDTLKLLITGALNINIHSNPDHKEVYFEIKASDSMSYLYTRSFLRQNPLNIPLQPTPLQSPMRVRSRSRSIPKQQPAPIPLITGAMFQKFFECKVTFSNTKAYVAIHKTIAIPPKEDITTWVLYNTSNTDGPIIKPIDINNQFRFIEFYKDERFTLMKAKRPNEKWALYNIDDLENLLLDDVADINFKEISSQFLITTPDNIFIYDYLTNSLIPISENISGSEYKHIIIKNTDLIKAYQRLKSVNNIPDRKQLETIYADIEIIYDSLLKDNPMITYEEIVNSFDNLRYALAVWYIQKDYELIDQSDTAIRMYADGMVICFDKDVGGNLINPTIKFPPVMKHIKLKGWLGIYHDLSISLKSLNLSNKIAYKLFFGISDLFTKLFENQKETPNTKTIEKLYSAV